LTIVLRSFRTPLKSNAGRLLLNVTRGVYYLKTKKNYTDSQKQEIVRTKCNAKTTFQKSQNLVPLIAGGLNHDATRAVGLAAGDAGLY
jgi:hypothetical protein